MKAVCVCACVCVCVCVLVVQVVSYKRIVNAITNNLLVRSARRSTGSSGFRKGKVVIVSAGYFLRISLDPMLFVDHTIVLQPRCKTNLFAKFSAPPAETVRTPPWSPQTIPQRIATPKRNHWQKECKKSTSRIPTWSPTVVLTRPEHA